MSKPNPDSDETFTEVEQRERDKLLLKLLHTPPDAKRPKRERTPKDKAGERDRS